MISLKLPVSIGLLFFLPIASDTLAQPSSSESERPYEDKVRLALAVSVGGLTAEEAAARAAATSPGVAVRRAEIELSNASQDSTLARYVPALTLTASATRTNPTDFNFGGGGLAVGALNPGQLSIGTCADGSGNNCVVDSAGQPVAGIAAEPFEIPRNNYSLVAQLSIPISDYLLQLPSARRASAADIAGALLRRDDERERVELDARVAYYEWLRARAQVAVADQSLISVRARLSDARIGLDSGTLAPADVLQIESLEAAAQVAIVNARSFEKLSRVNLATQTNMLADQITVGEDALAPTTTKITRSLPELVAHGQEHRSALRGLVAARKSAIEAAAGAGTQLYPRLDGIASVTHANPNQQFFPPENAWNTSWVVGLSLSWGLDRFFLGRAQRNELRANAKIFEAQLELARRGVTLEVTSAYQELRRAESAVDLILIDLAAAEAAYQQRVALYRAGEATTAEVVEVETQRFDASLRSINARIDMRIGLARLRRAAAIDPNTAGPRAPEASR